MDHKQLVAIFKKDVAMLYQRLQYILLRIHQYRIKILYKPRPVLFIADWFSQQNQDEDKDSEIPEIKISIDVVHTATDIQENMSMQVI